MTHGPRTSLMAFDSLREAREGEAGGPQRRAARGEQRRHLGDRGPRGARGRSGSRPPPWASRRRRGGRGSRRALLEGAEREEDLLRPADGEGGHEERAAPVHRAQHLVPERVLRRARRVALAAVGALEEEGVRAAPGVGSGRIGAPYRPRSPLNRSSRAGAGPTRATSRPWRCPRMWPARWKRIDDARRDLRRRLVRERREPRQHRDGVLLGVERRGVGRVLRVPACRFANRASSSWSRPESGRSSPARSRVAGVQWTRAAEAAPGRAGGGRPRDRRGRG